MTTDERLENLEKELARAKRRNRWLLAIVALAVVGLGLAWILPKTTATAQAQGAALGIGGARTGPVIADLLAADRTACQTMACEARS